MFTATYLPSRNGVATSTSLFARGLRELGHEVRIFAPTHPAQGLDRPGVETEPGVWRLPSTLWNAPSDYPVLLWPSPRVLGRLPLTDLDLIHTMHPFLAGQLARYWSRRLDVPLVFTAHTQYEQYLHYARGSRRANRSLLKAHVASFAHKVDRVLVPGRAMEEMLRSYGFQGPVGRLPNPVDLSAYLGLDGTGVRARYGLPWGEPVAVYLGRLAFEKNVAALLNAHALARQTLPGLRLLVVGDGPARASLQAAAGEGVTFTGAVPYAEVPAHLAAADIFVTASESEVLPMSMIEALAAGAPLVAARSPAALDLLDGGAGVLCEATPEALARGMLTALSPDRLPLLRELALASARGYELGQKARQLEAVYRELV